MTSQGHSQVRGICELPTISWASWKEKGLSLPQFVVLALIKSGD